MRILTFTPAFLQFTTGSFANVFGILESSNTAGVLTGVMLWHRLVDIALVILSEPKQGDWPLRQKWRWRGTGGKSRIVFPEFTPNIRRKDSRED